VRDKHPGFATLATILILPLSSVLPRSQPAGPGRDACDTLPDPSAAQVDRRKLILWYPQP